MLRVILIAAFAGLVLSCGLAASAQAMPGQLPGPLPGRAAEPALPARSSPTVLQAGGQGSVWNEIRSTKVFKACMPIYPPSNYKDNQGRWHGFYASMAQNIAKTLNVRLEYVETSLSTMVIDLETGRCQAILGLVITPQRAVAIDFAGPLYYSRTAMGTRKGYPLSGNKWADINKDTVRISVIQGDATVVRAEKGAPLAQKIILPSLTDAVMALQSNRADVYVGSLFEVLNTQSKNHMFGQTSIIQDTNLPSFVGVRYDDDGRFVRFLQNWAIYSRTTGAVTKWIIDALVEAGVKPKDIPTGVDFSNEK